MNNPAIQQTLEELQDSLSKIESARTQVNNISEKSEQLISSFTNVLRSIESISDGVGIDKDAIKENLDISFKNFEVDLREISKQSDVRIKGIDDNLKANQISFQEELNLQIKSFDSSIKKLVSDFEGNSEKQLTAVNTSTKNIETELNLFLIQLKGNVEKLEKNLKANQVIFYENLDIHSKSYSLANDALLKNVESNSLEQISLLTSSNQDLIGEIKNVGTELITFQDSVKKLREEITDLDFEKEFNLLSNKIDLKHKQSLIINSVLFLIIIVILFITK